MNVLKCNPIILNHEKLKRYVNQSWCDKLMKFFNGGVGTKVVFENLLGITVVCQMQIQMGLETNKYRNNEIV